MKYHFVQRFFSFLVLFACSTVPLSAATIRCADPKCPICLATAGATAPQNSDSREPRNRPEDAPFGRPASLAVVNPLFRSSLQNVISLRGDWQFKTDPDAVAPKEHWMPCMKTDADWIGSRTMPVPGNWESNGVGEPGPSTPWICSWDNTARPLRNIYIGSAWYRKTSELPADWQGKKVFLKIGGVRAQGWFWVNGKPVGHVTNYCGAFRFDVTDLVEPGKPATVVALVRNDVPSRTGLLSACHTWGGFNRDIELEAVPETHLANVECFGDFDTKSVNVRAEIAGTKTVELQIDVKTGDNKPMASRRVTAKPGEFVQNIELPDFRPWSPESPNLYIAEVKLFDGGKPVHGWIERFGVKKFEVRDKRFFLNDKPYFLRGYGDDYIYPETFIAPTDRDAHRKNLHIAKAAGFAFVRHHTHCEIPEYYDVADELGIMVQSELPYYPYNGFHTTEFFDFDPLRDLNEAIDHRRRYVSQAVYSMGNEGHLGTPLDIELKKLVHRRHPGALAMHNDGGVNTPENSDFDTPCKGCWPIHKANSILPWKPGDFDYVKMPFVAHEYMNLGLKFDPRISHRFTGAILPPRPVDRYEKRLADLGLDRRWGDACLDAGHALQKFYQKQGVEAARLDPECDGYSFWTLVDVIVNFGGPDNFTAQGMFSPFHEVKPGGTTPANAAKYNGPTTILMQSDRDVPILVEGETVKLSLSISHFGHEGLKNAAVSWSLKSDETKILEGRLDGIDAETGDVKPIGGISFTVPKRKKPERLVFEASIDGFKVLNDWEFWAFPKREKKKLDGVAATPDLYEKLSGRYDGLVKTGTPEGDAAKIVITSPGHADWLDAFKREKRVFLIGGTAGPANVKLGWWWIGDQTGTAFADHPVFGDFPHDGKISPLWFRLLKRGMPISKDMPFENLEYLSVGEGRNDYFLYAAQAGVGENGKLLMTHGLDLTADTPEAAYLTNQMLDYLAGDRCEPKGKIDVEKLVEEAKFRQIAASKLNGWSRTISAPQSHTGDAYFVGMATMRFMKCDRPNEIVWETHPVSDGDVSEMCTFYWLFGVGFVPDRTLEIGLSLDGKEQLRFKANVAVTADRVESGDAVLEYRRMAFMGNESTGVMALTVPHKMLKPGKTVQLRLSCDNLGFGDSWVGILEK